MDDDEWHPLDSRPRGEPDPGRWAIAILAAATGWLWPDLEAQVGVDTPTLDRWLRDPKRLGQLRAAWAYGADRRWLAWPCRTRAERVIAVVDNAYPPRAWEERIWRRFYLRVPDWIALANHVDDPPRINESWTCVLGLTAADVGPPVPRVESPEADRNPFLDDMDIDLDAMFAASKASPGPFGPEGDAFVASLGGVPVRRYG